jgi:hypothetical protein
MERPQNQVNGEEKIQRRRIKKLIITWHLIRTNPEGFTENRDI